jgi:hypothetical protein
MLKESNKFITRVHIYQCNGKVKIDISTVPVIDTDKTNEYKSLVSDEVIRFKKTENLHKNGILLEDITEGSNLQAVENIMLVNIYKMFTHKYWFKFSFKEKLKNRLLSLGLEV